MQQRRQGTGEIETFALDGVLGNHHRDGYRASGCSPRRRWKIAEDRPLATFECGGGVVKVIAPARSSDHFPCAGQNVRRRQICRVGQTDVQRDGRKQQYENSSR